MSMNGVKNYQNLLSWFISGLLFSIVYITPLLILFTNAFVSDVEPYLYYGNVFIVAIMLIAHVAHLIAFGMHIASYFSRCKAFNNFHCEVIYNYFISIEFEEFYLNLEIVFYL